MQSSRPLPDRSKIERIYVRISKTTRYFPLFRYDFRLAAFDCKAGTFCMSLNVGSFIFLTSIPSIKNLFRFHSGARKICYIFRSEWSRGISFWCISPDTFDIAIWWQSTCHLYPEASRFCPSISFIEHWRFEGKPEQYHVQLFLHALNRHETVFIPFFPVRPFHLLSWLRQCCR